MTALTLTLTNAGRAALINADNTGTNQVSIAKIGITQTAFNPAPTTTTLPGELKRLSTFSGAAVAADTVHITIRDESNASYSLRGFGLYLEDGTLFAVYSQTTPVMQKSAQSLLLLSVDIKLLQVAASAITFGNANFLNPPATTTVQGVIELATGNEAKAGTDSSRAITPSTLKAVLNAHEQPWGRITDQPATATRWPKWDEVDNKPNAFAPGAHDHAISDVTGLQTALAGKLDTTGGTLTGPLTINGIVYARGADNYNATYFLRDASNTNRGVLFFDRVNDRLEMRRYTPEGTTRGRFWINDDGTCQSAAGLFATGWMAIKSTLTGNAAFWLRDAENANHGALVWNRTLDAVQLQRRNPETGAVQGEIRIKSDGNVHIYGEVTAPLFKGNATSANKLTSSTKINGTSFNGTADIITSRWGAERTLKIGTTGKAVNGTGNVTWTLAEIGAAEAGHDHAINDVTGLQDALNSKANKAGQQYTGLHHFQASHVLWGQAPAETIRVELGPDNSATWLITAATGNQFKGGMQMLGSGAALRLYTINGQFAHLANGVWNKASIPALDYLSLAGGTLTGWLTIDTSDNAGNSLIRLRRTGTGQRTALVTTDANNNTGFIDEKPNNNQWLLRIDDNKNAHFQGNVSASGFNGNATSADTLKTARTLKIGNTGKAFNGSADVTWTPSEIGYSSGGGTNGWMKRPDGMIEQWGIYLMSTTSEITRSVTFPIAFPTACLNVTVTDINPVGPNNKNHYDMYAQINHGSPGKTGFSVYIQGPGNSSWNWVGMYWRAIGH